MTKQSVVVLSFPSGKVHTILLENNALESIIPGVTTLKTSTVKLTEINPNISIMGKQVNIVKPENGRAADMFLDGTNFATFLDRIDGFTLISTDASVTKDERVILNDEESFPNQAKGEKSIVSIEDTQGNEHLVIMTNQDINTIFTRVMATSTAPILQISSDNPQIAVSAAEVDYRDLGDGVINGMLYLTGTIYSTFMNHFAGMRIIRPNVEVDANQYIVSVN